MEIDHVRRRQSGFLERNRAAASRCRRKKKDWVGGLKDDHDKLESENATLMTERPALDRRGGVWNNPLHHCSDRIQCPIFRDNGRRRQSANPPRG